MYCNVVPSEFGGNEASTCGANAHMGQSVGLFVHLAEKLVLDGCLG